MLIKGSKLNAAQVNLVKSAFVNRLTFENMQNAKSMARGYVYQTDEEWILLHAFYFVKDGSRLMHNRRYCEPHYLAD